MSHEDRQWHSALDAIAHGVHAKHGHELQFSETIALEIIVVARSLGIPREAIHLWAADRERLARQETGNPAQQMGNDAASLLNRGLLVGYHADEQPDEEQN